MKKILFILTIVSFCFGYTFRLDSLTPNYGQADSNVTLHGKFYGNNLTCTLNTSAATVISQDTISAIIRIPVLSSGGYNKLYVTDSVNNKDSIQFFLFVLKIDSIVANHGRYNDRIRLYGTIPGDGISALFNGINAYTIYVNANRYVDSSFITIPKGSGSSNSIYVSCNFNPVHLDTTLLNCFTYDSTKIINTIDSGKYLDTLKIRGTGLGDTRLTVHLGYTLMPIVSRSDTLLKVKMGGAQISSIVTVSDGNETDTIYYTNKFSIVNAFEWLFIRWWSALNQFRK